jgi:hypothetical protein
LSNLLPKAGNEILNFVIKLSEVIPYFLCLSGMKILEERIQLVSMQHINLFKKEDLCELVKIIEDRCNPFPLFLPRNLGVEILVR